MHEKYNFSNSKYISCFVMGYILSYFWGEDGVPLKENKFAFTLIIPWLFGSIGAYPLFRYVTPESVAFSVGHIFLGEFFRILSILMLT